MKETNIAKLNVSVGIKVDDKTADMCLRLLEAYLDDNVDKTLYIYCDECGNWDLSILNRELVKLRQVSRNDSMFEW